MDRGTWEATVHGVISPINWGGREAMGTQGKSQASSLRTHGLHLTEASPGRQMKEKASRVAGNKQPGSGKQVLPWMAGSRQRK